MYTYKIKIKKVQGFLNESLQRTGIALRIKSSKKLSEKSLFEKADEYLNENYGVRLVEAVKTEFGKISGNRLVKPDARTRRRLGIPSEERKTAKVPAREYFKGRENTFKNQKISSSKIADDGYVGTEKKKRGEKWRFEDESERRSINYVFEYAIVDMSSHVFASGRSEDRFKKTPDLLSDILSKYGLNQFVAEDDVESYEKYKYVIQDSCCCIDIKNVESFDKKKSLRGIRVKRDVHNPHLSNYIIKYRVMPVEYYYDAEPLVGLSDNIEWNESGTVGRRLDRDVYDDDYIVTSDYRYDDKSDTWVGDEYPEY